MPPQEKSRLFNVTKQEPKFVNAEESQRLMLEAIAMLQRVERNNIGRDSVMITVKHNDPIMVVCGSDLHAGSIATRHQSIVDLRDYVLSLDNVGVVLLGDEVEGLKQEY